MLRLKVKYFLNDDGMRYFANWFDEVYTISSLQDGFKDLRYEIEDGFPVVYLDFESQDKLDQWIDRPQHDELASKIEPYFIKPLEVETEY
jgi:hypothetical protein